MRFLSAIATVAFALALCACGPQSPNADLVLRGGRVVTLDDHVPEGAAVAIVGDRIAAVGTEQQIAEWIGPSTEVLDLDGALAVPGFIEGHAHLKKLGRFRANLVLFTAASWDEIVEMVRQAAETAEPGQWIFGRGWHQEKWSAAPEPNVRGFPVHDELTRVAPDNPVHLRHASGHGSIDNLAAMERAGLDPGMSDPPGGEALRRAGGSLTGVFLENAENPLFDAYKADQDTPEESRRLFRAGAAECFAKGITSFQDAGLAFDDLDVLKSMVDDGEMKLRVYAMIDSEDPEFASKAAAYRTVGYGGDHRLTIRAIKGYVDGALGSRGAWLLEPYADLPGSRDAQCGQDAVLPGLSRWYVRPALDSDDAGLDRLPHVDVRVAPHEYVGMIDGSCDPALLRAVDQVVEQYSQPPARPRSESTHGRLQVIGSVEAFDDDALDPQIVAPDLLDELRVVHALDPDATGPRHPGRHGAEVDRAAGRDAR